MVTPLPPGRVPVVGDIVVYNMTHTGDTPLRCPAIVRDVLTPRDWGPPLLELAVFGPDPHHPVVHLDSTEYGPGKVWHWEWPS